MLGNMKPRKVRVHGRRRGEGTLQPFVVPIRQASKRETTYLGELLQVVLEGLPAQAATGLGAKRERGLPRRLFLGGGPSILKRETLITAFRYGEVSEQRADRIAGVVVQMIKFGDTQPLDRRHSRVASEGQHAHHPTDHGRVTREGLEPVGR